MITILSPVNPIWAWLLLSVPALLAAVAMAALVAAVVGLPYRRWLNLSTALRSKHSSAWKSQGRLSTSEKKKELITQRSVKNSSKLWKEWKLCSATQFLENLECRTLNQSRQFVLYLEHPISSKWIVKDFWVAGSLNGSPKPILQC